MVGCVYEPPYDKNPDAGHTWSDYVFDKKDNKSFLLKGLPLIIENMTPENANENHIRTTALEWSIIKYLWLKHVLFT